MIILQENINELEELKQGYMKNTYENVDGRDLARAFDHFIDVVKNHELMYYQNQIIGNLEKLYDY